MQLHSDQKIMVYKDEQSLSLAAAKIFKEIADKAIEERNRLLIALSGGSTPRTFFRILSRPPYSLSIPWQQCHFFWCDERLVAPDHPESNYGQAFDALFSKVKIPAENLHRIRGEADPAKAVEEYRKILESFGEGNRKWPRFDLALLGLGADGHTASLFPGTIHPEEESYPVMAVSDNYQERPTGRVTLTPLALNSARYLIFLVSGQGKAWAVQETLKESKNPEKWPAQRLQPVEGKILWLVDATAFSKNSSNGK
jgi:6-phosphogluconolactonase